MRSRLGRIVGALVSNPYYKLLSFVIAIGAWLYVQGGQLADAKVRASLEWHLPPGMSTTEPLPASVMLTVRGSRSATRRAQRADTKMVADLTEAEVGEHTLDFGSLPIEGLPPTVAVVGLSPSSIRLVLDEQTTRKVRVSALTVGDPPPGYSVVSRHVDPSVVELRGPRTVVSELTEVTTKPIDVSGLSADMDQPVELELPWGVTVAGGSWLRVEVDVEPLEEARVFAGVPVFVRNGAEWQIDTDTVQVTLKGPADLLREISADQLSAFVHLPDNPSRTRYEAAFGPTEGLRLSVSHPGDPSQVKVLSVRPATVEVSR